MVRRPVLLSDHPEWDDLVLAAAGDGERLDRAPLVAPLDEDLSGMAVVTEKPILDSPDRDRPGTGVLFGDDTGTVERVADVRRVRRSAERLRQDSNLRPSD